MIGIMFFAGWTKAEKQQFWLSLLFTMLVLITCYIAIVIFH